MLHLKTFLASCCLTFTLYSNVANATKLTVALKYQGRPLCGWNVTLYMNGGSDWGTAVSDANGIVEFTNLSAIKEGLDIKGVKNTKDGEKRWKFTDFIQYDKSVNFGDMNGTYDDTYVTLNCEKLVVEQYGQKLSNVEDSWGFSTADNDCSSSNKKEESNDKKDNLTNDIMEMRNLQKDMAAARKDDLEKQNTALKDKIARLKDRVAQTKNEQAGLTPGTPEHSNKSYDLRDFEIEREIAELELDRNLDEQSNNGQLSKSDRQRYNDKIDVLTAEQKRLLKDKKAGVLYGEKTLSNEEKTANEKAKKKEKEEEEEISFKIYSNEELANMSTFDLKRTKLSNNNSINKRRVKLKTNAAFLAEDKKAKLNEEIALLEKQVEAIKAILAQRNEKDDEEKK